MRSVATFVAIMVVRQRVTSRRATQRKPTGRLMESVPEPAFTRRRPPQSARDSDQLKTASEHAGQCISMR